MLLMIVNDVEERVNLRSESEWLSNLDLPVGSRVQHGLAASAKMRTWGKLEGQGVNISDR